MSLTYELVIQEDLNLGTEDEVIVTNPDGGYLFGTQIGIHTFAVGQLAVLGTWNPGAISAGSYDTTSVAVPGAAVGDFVQASLTTMSTDILEISAHVASADTVKVVLFNPSASPINPASGDLRVIVFKARSAA